MQLPSLDGHRVLPGEHALAALPGAPGSMSVDYPAPPNSAPFPPKGTVGAHNSPGAPHNSPFLLQDTHIDDLARPHSGPGAPHSSPFLLQDTHIDDLARPHSGPSAPHSSPFLLQDAHVDNPACAHSGPSAPHSSPFLLQDAHADNPACAHSGPSAPHSSPFLLQSKHPLSQCQALSPDAPVPPIHSGLEALGPRTVGASTHTHSPGFTGSAAASPRLCAPSCPGTLPLTPTSAPLWGGARAATLPRHSHSGTISPVARTGAAAADGSAEAVVGAGAADAVDARLPSAPCSPPVWPGSARTSMNCSVAPSGPPQHPQLPTHAAPAVPPSAAPAPPPPGPSARAHAHAPPSAVPACPRSSTPPLVRPTAVGPTSTRPGSSSPQLHTPFGMATGCGHEGGGLLERAQLACSPTSRRPSRRLELGSSVDPEGGGGLHEAVEGIVRGLNGAGGGCLEAGGGLARGGGRLATTAAVAPAAGVQQQQQCADVSGCELQQREGLHVSPMEYALPGMAGCSGSVCGPSPAPPLPLCHDPPASVPASCLSSANPSTFAVPSSVPASVHSAAVHPPAGMAATATAPPPAAALWAATASSVEGASSGSSSSGGSGGGGATSGWGSAAQPEVVEFLDGDSRRGGSSSSSGGGGRATPSPLCPHGHAGSATAAPAPPTTAEPSQEGCGGSRGGGGGSQTRRPSLIDSVLQTMRHSASEGALAAVCAAAGAEGAAGPAAQLQEPGLVSAGLLVTHSKGPKGVWSMVGAPVAPGGAVGNGGGGKGVPRAAPVRVPEGWEQQAHSGPEGEWAMQGDDALPAPGLPAQQAGAGSMGAQGWAWGRWGHAPVVRPIRHSYCGVEGALG